MGSTQQYKKAIMLCQTLMTAGKSAWPALTAASFSAICRFSLSISVCKTQENHFEHQPGVGRPEDTACPCSTVKRQQQDIHKSRKTFASITAACSMFACCMLYMDKLVCVYAAPTGDNKQQCPLHHFGSMVHVKNGGEMSGQNMHKWNATKGCRLPPGTQALVQASPDAAVLCAQLSVHSLSAAVQSVLWQQLELPDS